MFPSAEVQRDIPAARDRYDAAEELWDPSFRRLTLTFDPGRIKRGLTSNQTIGPPITEGRHYWLVIDREWPDARGVEMVEGFTKNFVGGPPDRTPPEVVPAPSRPLELAMRCQAIGPRFFPRMLRCWTSIGRAGSTTPQTLRRIQDATSSP